MSQSEFYSANLYRAYPLFTEDVDVFGLLVDAKIIVRPTVDYVHGRDQATLAAFGTITTLQGAILNVPQGPFAAFSLRLSKDDDRLLVAAFGQKETFEDVSMRLVSARQFFSTLDGVSTTTVERLAINDMSGWAVIGERSNFPDGYVRTDMQLEPTCVFATPEFSTGAGRTLAFNKRTTQYTPPIGCEHISPIAYVGPEYQLVCEVESGSVKLIGGKQARISQQGDINQISIIADGTSGDGGRPCDPIPLAEGQEDEDQSPRCEEVLRTINGLAGPAVTVSAGIGVSVQPHPGLHRLVIDIGTKDLQLCVGADNADEQVEHLPTDEQDRLCGDNNTEPLVPGAPDDTTGYSVVITPQTTGAPTVAPSNNRCAWQDNEGVWELVAYPCSSPRSCLKPSREPLVVNELVNTPCLPVVPTDGEYIRNADFTHPDVPLAAWDVTDGVEVVNSFENLPSSYFPVASLLTRGQPRVSMRQIMIKPIEGLYVFQVEVFLTSGRLTFMLTDSVTGNSQSRFEHNTYSNQVQQLVFGPFRIDAPLITLSVEFEDTVESTALVGFFALVDQ